MKIKYMTNIIAVLAVMTCCSYAALPTVLLTPGIIAAPGTANSTLAQNNWIRDAVAGTLATNRTISNPTNYAIADHAIVWHELVVSTTTNFWDGLFGPAAPFSGEKGKVAATLFEIRSATGSNDVSLAMAQGSFQSSDGNALGSSFYLTNTSYTPRAAGVMVDGSLVTSGAATNMVNRVLFIAYPKYFVANSAADLAAVKSWMLSYWPYRLTSIGYVSGNTATKSLASVCEAPLMMAPNVLLSKSGMLNLVGGETNATYIVYSSSSVEKSFTNLVAVVTGTNGWPISVPVSRSEQARFFRVRVQ